MCCWVCLVSIIWFRWVSCSLFGVWCWFVLLNWMWFFVKKFWFLIFFVWWLRCLWILVFMCLVCMVNLVVWVLCLVLCMILFVLCKIRMILVVILCFLLLFLICLKVWLSCSLRSGFGSSFVFCISLIWCFIVRKLVLICIVISLVFFLLGVGFLLLVCILVVVVWFVCFWCLCWCLMFIVSFRNCVILGVLSGCSRLFVVVSWSCRVVLILILLIMVRCLKFGNI